MKLKYYPDTDSLYIQAVEKVIFFSDPFMG